jgi:SAM-dependent methyltransferase
VSTEPDRVVERYARRAVAVDRYAIDSPGVRPMLQERRRAMVELLAGRDLATLQVVEVGCGSGGNLAELLALGFKAEHLQGIELLPDRWAEARRLLPEALRLIEGDASVAPIAPASQDIVYASTVFSSLLDRAFQQRLAAVMWQWLKPGGAVLWYDFTVNNPRNPDVRGVPLARVQALFPQGRIKHRRVTLVPPLARALCRVHPALYGVANALPLLRTHVLAWVEKPQKPAADNRGR